MSGVSARTNPLLKPTTLLNNTASPRHRTNFRASHSSNRRRQATTATMHRSASAPAGPIPDDHMAVNCVGLPDGALSMTFPAGGSGTTQTLPLATTTALLLGFVVLARGNLLPNSFFACRCRRAFRLSKIPTATNSDCTTNRREPPSKL